MPRMVRPYRPDNPSFNLARHVLTAAAADAEKTALIIDHGQERAEIWSYGDLQAAVLRLAGFFEDFSLPAGSRVLIRLGNESGFVIAYLAAIAAGLVAIPSSAALTAAEAEHIAHDADIALCLTRPGIASPASLPSGARSISFEALTSAMKRHHPGGHATTRAEDPAYILYTSGTSGRPKGVIHAQRAILGRRPMYRGWLGLGPGDRMLHAGAFNWSYTLGVGLLDPWCQGATAIIYTGPKSKTVWTSLIRKHKATLFAAVPGLYRQWLKYDDFSGDDIPSLRHGLTAGEKLSPALLELWRQRTDRPLYEALGMTEISTYISSGPECPIRPGSPGRPQPGRRVAILSETPPHAPLPPGKRGLLAVHRSDPGLMLGYWRRPEEEAEVFFGDYFAGGDIAHMDEDGYVHFHGRASEIMNSFGYRVAPQEVEEALLHHPAVQEVAVAECAIDEEKSVIAAFVVVRDGSSPPKAQDLIAFSASRLADYKRPREIRFVDALPRSANGKILRRRLTLRRKTP